MITLIFFFNSFLNAWKRMKGKKKKKSVLGYSIYNFNGAFDVSSFRLRGIFFMFQDWFLVCLFYSGIRILRSKLPRMMELIRGKKEQQERQFFIILIQRGSTSKCGIWCLLCRVQLQYRWILCFFIFLWSMKTTSA